MDEPDRSWRQWALGGGIVLLVMTGAEPKGWLRITEAQAQVKHTREAPAFRLEDQFDTLHDYRFPRQKVSVLLLADRSGSAQLEAWIQPLVDRFAQSIEIHGVAEVSLVPAFAKGWVRSAFRKRLKHPVMLDWTGDVCRTYDYQAGQANLLVIDAMGRIVLRVHGAIDPAKRRQVFTAIAQVVADAVE